MAGSSDPAKENFVLRFTGADAKDAGAPQLQARLENTAGVRVIDASPRMLLVCGPRAAIEQAAGHFPGWQLIPETHSPLP